MKPFRSILCISAMLCCTLFSLGQSKEIDSIQELLKTANDTAEVNLLRRQGILLRSYDKDKALGLLLESVEKSKKKAFWMEKSTASIHLGLPMG